LSFTKAGFRARLTKSWIPDQLKLSPNMPKKTFEAAMKRLEEIVTELEDGNLSLEVSLKRYEEGVQLTRFCSEKLDHAESRIKELVKEGGEFRVKDTDI